MERIDEVYDKIEAVESLYGYLGVAFVFVCVILLFISWWHLKTHVESYAKSHFNQSLSEFQANLINEIGKSFIIQKGEIEKEITNLKGRIDKEISIVSSTLNLLTGQKANYLNKRRKVLNKLFTSLFDWTTTVVDMSPFELDSDNIGVRNEMINKMNVCKHKFNIASASYHIYGRDPELNNIMQDLMMEATRLQLYKELQLLEVEGICIQSGLLKAEMKRGDIQQEKYESLKTELNSTYDMRLAKIEETDSQINEKYKEVVRKQTIASSKISHLIKETYQEEE